MPADDYTSAFSGGALKLKGAKVSKPKKKKKNKERHGDAVAGKKRELLERVASGEENEDDLALVRRRSGSKGEGSDDADELDDRIERKKKKRREADGSDEQAEEVEGEDEDEGPRMTEAERRHEELKRKRVSAVSWAGPQTTSMPSHRHPFASDY